MSRRIAIAVSTSVVVAVGLLSGLSGPASARTDVAAISTGRVWSTVSAGGNHTCGIRLDHTLWCWGANQYGQLGTGGRVGHSTPTQVGDETDWSSVSPGSNHTCGLRTDQTLWCWGHNKHGQLGLGDIGFKHHNRPQQVGDDTDWAQLSSGGGHTCAVRTDGTLWCWGYNHSGQLGTGKYRTVYTPTQVGAATDWAQVAAGYEYTCGIRTDQTLWCWGTNYAGQLGLGDTAGRNVPTQVGSDQWTEVSPAYQHTCGITTAQTLWCWGSNSNGQLGLGDTTSRTTPTQVGSDSDWTQVSVHSAYAHTCAITSSSTLWCWGYNQFGQLGVGDWSDRNLPTQVGTGTTWTQLGTGSDHSCAIRANDSLWCWGYDAFGALGTGGGPSRNVPTRV